jgi:hypothetical protein
VERVAGKRSLCQDLDHQLLDPALARAHKHTDDHTSKLADQASRAVGAMVVQAMLKWGAFQVEVSRARVAGDQLYSVGWIERALAG